MVFVGVNLDFLAQIFVLFFRTWYSEAGHHLIVIEVVIFCWKWIFTCAPFCCSGKLDWFDFFELRDETCLFITDDFSVNSFQTCLWNKKKNEEFYLWSPSLHFRNGSWSVFLIYHVVLAYFDCRWFLKSADDLCFEVLNYAHGTPN